VNVGRAGTSVGSKGVLCQISAENRIFFLKLQNIIFKFYFPRFLQYFINFFNFCNLSALYVMKSIRVLIQICPYCWHGSFFNALNIFQVQSFFLVSLFPLNLAFTGPTIVKNTQDTQKKQNVKFSANQLFIYDTNGCTLDT
jgi:hypothetical protein